MGRRPLICFVHIERAGGTTLHYLLRNNFTSFLTLAPSVWTNDDSTAFSPAELAVFLRWLPFTSGFGGHGARSYLGYEDVVSQPVRFFTFLRDPVRRYISHFNYQVHELGNPWTIESFMAEPRFDNFMTKRLAGSFDLDEARRRLASDFAFVGLSEQFDESLVLMKHAFAEHELDIRYERQNRSRDPRYDETRKRLADPALAAAIRERNVLDIELYRHAVEEIYPRQIEAFPGSIRETLTSYREANRGYRFRARRRMAWGAYRRFVYAPLEGWVRLRRRASRPDPEFANL